jgi:hypothetical protein
LSGTELVTNGDFSSSTGWTIQTGWSIASGVATCDGTAGYLYQTSGIPANTQVSATIDITSYTSGTLRLGATGITYAPPVSGVGTHTVTFTSWTLGSGVELYSNNFVGTIDNISVKEAIPDRSVKGNGIAVHGTPTVSAVATGAELKCISGFSTPNYLEQPYNSDLDFGTGDFSISGWVYFSSGSTHDFIKHSNGTTGWILQFTGSRMRFRIHNSGDYLAYLNDVLPTNSWNHFVIARVNGVIAGYLNGNNETSSGADNMTHTVSVNTPLTFSKSSVDTIALVRISATAPTAEQIKEIYEAEKPLFQANAKCTLDGTSDAVTAMDYDDSNEELLVGTATNLSVFKGLRRVDENTNNITEVAQQGGLRVEEY